MHNEPSKADARERLRQAGFTAVDVPHESELSQQRVDLLVDDGGPYRYLVEAKAKEPTQFHRDLQATARERVQRPCRFEPLGNPFANA